MGDPLTYLQRQTNIDWLIGYSSQDVLVKAEHIIQELLACQHKTHPDEPLKILLAHRDPVQFLAHFIAACTIPSHLFLCNPDWAEAEWQQVFELVQPDLTWPDETFDWSLVIGHWSFDKTTQHRGSNTPSLFPTPHPPFPQNSELKTHILIPTGGSSGKIRFVIHTWDTLIASVRGFQQYFEVEQVNSCCVLPLYHVSGLMQVMRSLTSGGQLVILPFKAFESGPSPHFDPQEFFLSLVPTQLHRLIQHSRFTETLPPSSASYRRSGETSLPGRTLTPSHLHTPHPLLFQFKTILLGGAPAWPELLNQARQLKLPLAPTYGMTETASQIATLKPKDFLQGKTGAGQVLPHVQIQICNEQGDRLPANQPGLIHIHSQSLALGYYTPTPDPRPPIPDSQFPIPIPFQPDDIGYLDDQSYLHLLGRHSDKIITGGENVFPAEVEAAIQATGLVMDVYVMGVSDRLWGQAITAFYSPIDPNLSVASLKASLQTRLSKFKHPKHWIAVESLPRNAQGKINQAHLRAWAADHFLLLADHLHTETPTE